jgi:pSer/pThr/pTyr-binding forkhead associated (FHA) protein
MWKLVIEDDEGNRTLVPLTRELYTIGRRDGNTIRLTERNVSRDHAKLSKKNGAPVEKATFVLEDLTSYNGVFVNGLRITHAQDLTQGDLVQIGDYRIVLQDEVQTDAAAPASGPSSPRSAIDEAKVTIPGAPYARVAHAAFDRPNRLVMIVGPAPGSEFPMDRELLTIGRAEEATISVNHNSVSRMHCEVRALGEGRFEIVDNESSNGVRVNGTELRRGIVEPGDLIELGDVRFKFVAAGKLFRPTDSQQFELLSDTTATDVIRPRRGGTMLPVAIFAAVVVAGGLGAWLHSRWRGEGQVSSAAAVPRGPSPEQSALDDAKKACFAGDCELAHAGLEAAIAESSSLRSSPDFKDIENRWADQVLARADAEPDVTKKRSLYQRVSQSVSADPGRRKIAADKLQQLDTSTATLGTNPTQLPVAFEMTQPSEAASPPSRAERAESNRKPAQVAEAAPPAAAPAPNTSTASPPAATRTAGVDDRERQLALQGTQDSKVLLKQQLEPRVFGGKATDTEIRLLISTCKDLGDKTCVQQARAVWAQKQSN